MILGEVEEGEGCSDDPVCVCVCARGVGLSRPAVEEGPGFSFQIFFSTIWLLQAAAGLS